MITGPAFGTEEPSELRAQEPSLFGETQPKQKDAYLAATKGTQEIPAKIIFGLEHPEDVSSKTQPKQTERKKVPIGRAQVLYLEW